MLRNSFLLLSVLFLLGCTAPPIQQETPEEVVIVETPVEQAAVIESEPEQPEQSPETTETESTEQQTDSKYPIAPEFVDIQGYINTEEGLTLESLHGNVVLIDFWTYSCINCQRTLPFVKDWHEKYADQGLVIVGIHTPEFNFEKDFDNVMQKVNEYGITYPVIQDNNKKTFRAYENRFWPRKYLIDTEGFIRYDRIGEGAYQKTEDMIKKLLAEKAAQDTPN